MKILILLILGIGIITYGIFLLKKKPKIMTQKENDINDDYLEMEPVNQVDVKKLEKELATTEQKNKIPKSFIDKELELEGIDDYVEVDMGDIDIESLMESGVFDEQIFDSTNDVQIKDIKNEK